MHTSVKRTYFDLDTSFPVPWILQPVHGNTIPESSIHTCKILSDSVHHFKEIKTNQSQLDVPFFKRNLLWFQADSSIPN